MRSPYLNNMLPVLYSFRRCPYAMRARMALFASGVAYEHREVALRAKPPAMLAVSPKGTVPVLVLPSSHVIEESLEIMHWALAQSDPEGWLVPPEETAALIAENDGDFKRNLDAYKYRARDEITKGSPHREQGLIFLQSLDRRLGRAAHLVGARRTLADVAIFPFVRQFAATDPMWFSRQPLPALHAWLQGHVASDLFAAAMHKHELWAGTPAIV